MFTQVYALCVYIHTWHVCFMSTYGLFTLCTYGLGNCVHTNEGCIVLYGCVYRGTLDSIALHDNCLFFTN